MRNELVMRKGMMRFTAAQMELLEELRSYQREGCSIYLNGRPSMPGEVVAACFREDTSYMRDIVSDEHAVIRKINFVRIKKK